MKRRFLVPALGALCVLVAIGDAQAQSGGGQFMASDTYYHLDVAVGGLTARVEAEVQPSGDELTEVLLWAMPGARDITVTRDGSELAIEVDAAIADLPTLVSATLEPPLKGKLTTDLVMTYSVPSGTTALTDIQPGGVETMLVSQGPGSFLLVDLPSEAENVLDPGCVLASNQPGDVRETGFERWVCGEVLAAAFGGDDDSVRQRCAALNDDCRQRMTADPFSAFVQSTTDSSLLSNLDADVALTNGAIPLRLRYFRSNRDWAETQFSVAQQALPKLEQLFGFAYAHDEILLRESTYLVRGGARGIAFTDTGEMLLAAGTGVESHTTIHELAHQWAGLNLDEPWIWEGLAEFARRSIGPELGLSPYLREWQSLGYTDPLATMYNGSSVFDPDYWYGRSGDFWFAFESAVGGRENMTAVLSRIDDEPGVRRDGRWFMDAGEDVSGANLDALFLEWVWQPDYANTALAERRAAYDLVSAFKAEAAAAGLLGLPVDIQANLREWSFEPVAAQLGRAREVLAAYQELLAASAAAGLTPPATVAEVWGSTTIAALDRLVGDYMQTATTLQSAAGELSALDPSHPALGQLDEARTAYNNGDLDAADDLAGKALATVYNVEASALMLKIAAEEQENYTENFVKRIGLLWSTPASDLEAARIAYDSGDHAEALALSRSAYESWNGAHARGFKRLAMLAGLMGGLSFLTWWLLSRMDRGDRGTRDRSIHDGHRLERADPTAPRSRSSRWRDWENMP